jgi:NAD(P)H dehydrogenase (quinone)
MRVPMVATADIGRVAAAVLQHSWNGHQVIELEGPRRVAPNDVGAAFERILGHSVQMEAVPRADWESIFKTQGMKNPLPRIQMIDGFNEGWIEFEGGESGSIKGDVELETVLQKLVERT